MVELFRSATYTASILGVTPLMRGSSGFVAGGCLSKYMDSGRSGPSERNKVNSADHGGSQREGGVEHLPMK